MHSISHVYSASNHTCTLSPFSIVLCMLGCVNWQYNAWCSRNTCRSNVFFCVVELWLSQEFTERKAVIVFNCTLFFVNMSCNTYSFICVYPMLYCMSFSVVWLLLCSIIYLTCRFSHFIRFINCFSQSTYLTLQSGHTFASWIQVQLSNF